ncbi:MAG: amino acid permease [Phycisphaerales bacterium]|nr:amino acid permease [Phycisphaerales bacterium]MCI0677380.1 amino acid permease [Phycisphaerales bacterium]
MRPDLPRTIGFWAASAIMVGIVIGSGIFATPTDIARETGSPALILTLWIAGGILSLFGALTYAELAVMYPHSGGVYLFIREGLGRGVAFVFGWTYMLISKPLAAAGIAVIFAQHFNPLVGINADDSLARNVTTCTVLVILTAINVRGLRLGGGVAGLLTSIKVFALLAIVVLALILMNGSTENFRTIPPPTDKSWWLALAPIMAGILWTYDGWSDAGSIAGEIRDPHRQLPRIYVVGTIMLIALYLAVNAVYIWMIPLPEMAATTTIAPLVADRLLGHAGQTAVSIIVVISTLGATHGAIITGARINFAQACDGLLFSHLSRIHSRYQTPAVALWVQCALSCIAVWLYQFQQLAGGFVFTMWIFYGLAAATIFTLRRRHPDAPRAYRCWGYPIVPALFIVAAAAMTALAIAESPRTTLPWLAILLAGIPVYLLWRRFCERPHPSPGG